MPLLIGVGLLIGASVVLAAFLALSVWVASSDVATLGVLAIFLLSGATIAGYGVTTGHPPIWLLIPFGVAVLAMMGSAAVGDGS